MDEYDYKQFAVLYVDDEEKSLKSFERAFSEQFRIYTAVNAQAGWKVFEEHRDDIGVIMTDQRMPGEKGVWLLERARRLRPRVLRMLVTAYSDMEAAIAAVNSGAIYRYISKPWDPPQLEQTLKHGLEFFLVQRQRDQLLHEKMSVLHNLLIADRIVSLGLLAAGLSHHIRNSLVAVKTFLDLAPAKLEEEKVEMNELRNPGFWKDYYESVQTQIERINHLLKDLWTASEKPAFEFGDQIVLQQVINEAAQGLSGALQKKRIELVNEVPGTLPPMNVDRTKFNRLFELLLKDELATLPEGACIRFSAELAPDAPVDAPQMLIRMRDNGPGLPKESLRLVFDPFLVRNDSPAEYGIHLMACFFIVHHHGGRIEAHNEEGQGTVFTLRIPLNPAQTPPPDTQSDYVSKLLLNSEVWEKLLTAPAE